ncbi:MAG: 6,7-dimethyl-8-ribityllumazine synthase [Flavobacteriaceae bacterium]|nr:6,7-dimethyl-8-ribityllumazine synthase [Flavobacteriaceae bacterium]
MATINLSAYHLKTIPNAKDIRFGIVVSEWNSDITENLFLGVSETLQTCGAITANIIRKNVPGSFELIFGAKKMIAVNNVDVIIVIGNVIQGETKHFDFVCQGVTQGIKDLNILYNVPVVFCVLTDANKQQSIDRSGGKYGNKGVEAAITAIKMAKF